MKLLQGILKVDTNFDVVYRTISAGGRTACLYFVDGLTKDEVLLKLLQVFSSVQEQDMPADAHEFSKKYLPYGEVDLTTDVDSMVTRCV